MHVITCIAFIKEQIFKSHELKNIILQRLILYNANLDPFTYELFKIIICNH